MKKTYKCPMHPEVVSDKPESCTKCGMRLVLSGSDEKSEKQLNKISKCCC